MESKDPTKFIESFRFFANYGHYVLVSLVICILTNLLRNKWGTNNLLSTSKQIVAKGDKNHSAKELKPDEGKFYCLFFMYFRLSCV